MNQQLKTNIILKFQLKDIKKERYFQYRDEVIENVYYNISPE